MIQIENVEVVGLEHAIRGMRNPKNSWDKIDSAYCLYSTDESTNHCGNCEYWQAGLCHADEEEMGKNYVVGPNDHKLMMSLAKGGPVHAKYRRMIVVYLDITAPLYLWKEIDVYKVGTVTNSCSTMHKIADKEFTRNDFSCEHLIDDRSLCYHEDILAGPESVSPPLAILDIVIDALNTYREKYLVALKTESETGLPAKDIWWQMIQLLPSSYNQKRTLMLNYEVLHNIYFSRKDHKLDEWRELCKWIESLPYSELITTPMNAVSPHLKETSPLLVGKE